MAKLTGEPFDKTHALNEPETICLSRCGSYKRYFDMRKHFENGTCPFCPGNGLDPKVNKNLLIENDVEHKHWMAWYVGKGLRPHEEGLDLHLMIVPREHHRSWDTFSTDEKLSLLDVLNLAWETHDIPGGMMLMRFGHMKLNGGTEQHISFQIKVPNKTKALVEPLTKTPEHVEENLSRGGRFSELYEEDTSPAKFDEMFEAGDVSKDGHLLG